MSEPNPPLGSRRGDCTVSSSASTTLVGSIHSCSSSASNHSDTAAYTYNIDRFGKQDNINASTVYDRIPTNPSDPHPTARIHFYTTRAASVIEAFNAAFGVSSQR